MKEAFGVGNMVGLAAVGVPLDLFGMNREVSERPMSRMNPKPLPVKDAPSGYQLDQSHVEGGLVVSLWREGKYFKAMRFEDHWWGKPRYRQARRLYEKWEKEYKVKMWGSGMWTPVLMGYAQW